MSKTPKKRRVSDTVVDSPAALKGKRIECPGPIFHESPEKIYAGVILGTPSGKKNSVTVPVLMRTAPDIGEPHVSKPLLAFG